MPIVSRDEEIFVRWIGISRLSLVEPLRYTRGPLEGTTANGGHCYVAYLARRVPREVRIP